MCGEARESGHLAKRGCDSRETSPPGPIARVDKRGAGLRGTRLTRLYRAVDGVELAEIVATGAFRNPPGIEVKYFAISTLGARQYAVMAAAAFGDKLTVVKTSIRTSGISPAMRVTVDRRISTVVIPTSKLGSLARPEVLE